MRGGAALVAALSLTIGCTSVAQAGVSAGARCTKVNQTAIVGATTYKCVKVGTKLVWRALPPAKIGSVTPALPFAGLPIPSFEFTDGAHILGPAELGLPLGNDELGAESPVAAHMRDGRIRLYFMQNEPGQPHGIRSAISADGLHFTVEAGDRIPRVDEKVVSPLIYPLADGRFRLYFREGDTIKSAISSDGYDFTREAGIRLPATAFGSSSDAAPACQAIAKTAAGNFRMYCTVMTARSPVPRQPDDLAIFSATSSDLLNWTPEPTPRITKSAMFPTGAMYPTIVQNNADGSLVMIFSAYNFNFKATEDGDTGFDRHTAGQEMIAYSKDGLTFDPVIATGLTGHEVFYLAKDTTSGFVYRGHATQAEGGYLLSATASLAQRPFAINFLAMDSDPGVVGGFHVIMVQTSPNVTCTGSAKTSAGRVIEFRKSPTAVAPASGVLSWALPIPEDAALGVATATVACMAGGVTASRSTTFRVVSKQ